MHCSDVSGGVQEESGQPTEEEESLLETSLEKVNKTCISTDRIVYTHCGSVESLSHCSHTQVGTSTNYTGGDKY